MPKRPSGRRAGSCTPRPTMANSRQERNGKEMIKLKENSKRAEDFKADFRKALAFDKLSLLGWYKNPSASKIRAYENLIDFYFDAEIYAVTYANQQSFIFMALYPSALYVHTLHGSYRIKVNEDEFEDFKRLYSAL